MVQVIEFGRDGGKVSVRRVESATFTASRGSGMTLDYAVLVVAPTTHVTYQPAGYTLRVRAAQ